MVFLALFFVIVLGLAVGAFLFVRQAQTKKPASTTAAEVVEAGGSLITQSAENVQRKNDAAILLSTVAEYISSNQGQAPLALKDGMLQGMGYYASASVAQGAQEPLASDELRLVTAARCEPNGATAPSTSRAYAAQFMVRSGTGLTAQCVDG